jgi:hypothetical protein
MEKRPLKDLDESRNDALPERPMASLVFFNAIAAKVIGIYETVTEGGGIIST